MRGSERIAALLLLCALAALPPVARATPWELQQRIYDVDTTQGNWQAYLNAQPVKLVMTHSGRGYLATLHTVFQTTNGGRTWRNLDRFPPPNSHSSDFDPVRLPHYISDMAARPIARDSIRFDSLYLTAFNAERDTGAVWLVQYTSGQHWLYPQRQLGASSWLTGLVLPDSNTAVAIAGFDGELYRNDSLARGMYWQQLSTIKAFPRIERTDSTTPQPDVGEGHGQRRPVRDRGRLASLDKPRRRPACGGSRPPPTPARTRRSSFCDSRTA